jgi:hypothetical protein
VGYAIAAYALVLGTLAAYGLWIHAQRRALRRREELARSRPGDAR